MKPCQVIQVNIYDDCWQLLNVWISYGYRDAAFNLNDLRRDKILEEVD